MTDLEFKIRLSGIYIIIVISSHAMGIILTLVIRVANEGKQLLGFTGFRQSL